MLFDTGDPAGRAVGCLAACCATAPSAAVSTISVAAAIALASISFTSTTISSTSVATVAAIAVSTAAESTSAEPPPIAAAATPNAFPARVGHLPPTCRRAPTTCGRHGPMRLLVDREVAVRC